MKKWTVSFVNSDDVEVAADDYDLAQGWFVFWTDPGGPGPLTPVVRLRESNVIRIDLIS